MGINYKVLNGFIYYVMTSVCYSESQERFEMNVYVSFKPIIVDEVFWKAFDMYDTAKEQPFSFHVCTAFACSSHMIEHWLTELTLENLEDIHEATLTKVNQIIWEYGEHFHTAADFRELVARHRQKGDAELQIMLCDVATGIIRRRWIWCSKNCRSDIPVTAGAGTKIFIVIYRTTVKRN